MSQSVDDTMRKLHAALDTTVKQLLFNEFSDREQHLDRRAKLLDERELRMRGALDRLHEAHAHALKDIDTAETEAERIRCVAFCDGVRAAMTALEGAWLR